MGNYRILVKGVVKRDNKYLIVQKWFDDNIIEPYQWEFVDGEADFGESPDAAVVRVVKEKTGIDATVDCVLYTWTLMIGSVCNLGLAYLCITDQNEDDVILSEDLNDAKWIESVDFEEYIHNRHMLDDLEKAELY